MLNLSKDDAIFVGFKLDGSLKYQVENLEGPNARYVSADSSENLRLCNLDGDLYVGKLVEAELTTDRVDDLRRNVLSIMQRLFPEVRMPNVLAIRAVRLPQGGEEMAETAPFPEAVTSHLR